MKKYSVIFIMVILSGCSSKVYDYELKRIAEICGGYEEIKSVWRDLRMPRAACKDGSLVSPKD